MRICKALSTFFALLFLGQFSLQAVTLPAHDIRHSFEDAKTHSSPAPTLTDGRCELCQAYRTGSATPVQFFAVLASTLSAPLAWEPSALERSADLTQLADARAPPILL